MHETTALRTTGPVLDSDEVNRLLESDFVAVWVQRGMGAPGFPYVLLDRPLDYTQDEPGELSLLILQMNARGEVLDQHPTPARMADLLWFDAAAITLRSPLREFARKNVRAKRLSEEVPVASRLGREVLRTKAARLRHSFMSVELRSEHYQRGDEGPYLRDMGFSPVVAAQLVAWGDQNQLVSTFENSRGVSDGRHCWMPEFLADACLKHIELFGSADLPEEFVCWAERFLARQAQVRERHPDRQRP